jgi:hypothetical protein
MLAEGQLDLRLLPHRGGEADLRGVVSSYSAEVGSSVRRGGHEHEGRDDPGVYRRWWRTRDEDVESCHRRWTDPPALVLPNKPIVVVIW